MASIIQGFEYDIFISYRQNDNRSGWVTEFVNYLKEELAAVIKEPVTIYFDASPHDGLLETHNVGKSLEGKLKCLVFIPILSQTYCDPKSFAWQHEFCAFNKLSREDQLGRDIKLNNGNVSSRILPIKIHELDEDDESVIENEIDGAIRSIEFIYSELGVNRPIKPIDNKTDNLNKTEYHNQINKLANAVKEILLAIQHPDKSTRQSQPRHVNVIEAPVKSIAVLPFFNNSDDQSQEYFSDGLTEEIISDLSRVNELKVISRSSIMTLKGSQKKLTEIAQDVNVRYVLEGSVRKSGNNLRITAQLIDAVSDSHLWSEKYNGTLDDVFDIQEKVSRSIVDALQLKLSPKENSNLSSRPITNIHAYECYLKSRREMFRGTKETMEYTFKLIENALELVGDNELLYASLGYANYFYFRFVDKLDQTYLTKVEDCAKKVFELNPESPHGHVLQGWIHTTRGNLQESIRSMNRALRVDPNNYDALSGIAASYIWSGNCRNTTHIAEKIVEIDPLTPFSQVVRGGYIALDGRLPEALEHFVKAHQMDPQSPFYLWQVISAYVWCDRPQDAYPLMDRLAELAPHWPVTGQVLFLKHGLLGDIEKALTYVSKEFTIEAESDPHFAFHLAECYAVVDNKKMALDYLEQAISGFFPWRFLLVDPLLANIKNEERFRALVEKAKQKSEAIEI